MSSSVPQAVPAFIAIAQAALPAGFQVREGSIFGPYAAPQALLITGIHFLVDEYGELGPRYAHEERYNIMCSLSSSAGTDDGPSRLAEVYGLYSDISVAVANNPNLTNTVRLGWCRQLDFLVTSDGRLNIGTLNFEVECQVRVNSLT